MSDLISRESAIYICECAIDLWQGLIGSGALIAVRDKIKELPSAEPEPITIRIDHELSPEEVKKKFLDTPIVLLPERKTGRWIETNPRNSEICRRINCSECGKGYIVNINVPYEDWTDAHKFCVECGAKMEVES